MGLKDDLKAMIREAGVLADDPDAGPLEDAEIAEIEYLIDEAFAAEEDVPGRDLNRKAARKPQ